VRNFSCNLISFQIYDIIYIEKMKERKNMFLLIINWRDECEMKDFPKLPEFTLWETFADAQVAAFEAAAECGAKIDMTDAEIHLGAGTMFLPGFAEVMPISISNHNRITWKGREWKNEGRET
jgi:hypothetical protein